MSSAVLHGLTLEAFLALPETEPASEFLDGRVVQKVSPKTKHSVLQGLLCQRLNDALMPRYYVLPEQRCTFAGRSLVPDIAVFERDRIPLDDEGEVADDVFLAPDAAIEILSPGQSIAELEAKLQFCVAHGVSLGWLIDPYAKRVRAFRSGGKTETLEIGGVLEDAAPPGFRLPLAELFRWLKGR